jgi:hypothetical protein
MPKKRPEHRPGFYRLFLRDNYFDIKWAELGSHDRVLSHLSEHNLLGRPLPKEEIESLYQAHSKKLFSPDEASKFYSLIGSGWAKWKIENIRARMKKLAAASWTADARKNRCKRKRIRKKCLKKGESVPGIEKRVPRSK